MAQATQERQRANAFSAAEKKRLIECVQESSDIIENKQTDKHSKKAKEDAWALVTKQFNEQSTNGNICTVKQLKTLYKNSKREANKHVAEDKVIIDNVPMFSF
jgi:hypothetical protein